jgi:hypothetical protein
MANIVQSDFLAAKILAIAWRAIFKKMIGPCPQNKVFGVFL